MSVPKVFLCKSGQNPPVGSGDRVCRQTRLVFIVARTTPLRKIEKMIDFNIFCKRTGLEKFTGANCDQIGPLVETLSSFKVGAR